MINLYESVNRKFNNLDEDFNDVVHIYTVDDFNKLNRDNTHVVIHDNPNLVGYLSFSLKAYVTHLRLENIQEIPSRAFSNVRNLLQVDAPDLLEIGNHAFYHCTNLRTFNAPQLSVVEEEAFADCLALSDLNLLQVTSIGKDAFNSTLNFRKIILPDAPIEASTRIFGSSGVKYLRIYQTDAMRKNHTLDEMYNLEEITFTGEDPIDTSLFYDSDYMSKALRWVHVPKGVQVNYGFIGAIEKRKGIINYY